MSCWRHDLDHREYVCTCDPPNGADSGREDSAAQAVAEAIAAWEAKGPTSLTVALMAEALYAVRGGAA